MSIFLSVIDDRDDSTVLRNVLTANVLYSNDDNDVVGDDTWFNDNLNDTLLLNEKHVLCTIINSTNANIVVYDDILILLLLLLLLLL